MKTRLQLFSIAIAFCAVSLVSSASAQSGSYYDRYGNGYSREDSDRSQRDYEDRLQQERDLQSQRDQLDEERRDLDEERARFGSQSTTPETRKEERCPAGFQPSENKCSAQERKHGCKDMRLSSGLGCVHR